MVNISDSSATVTLTAYNDTGSTITTETRTINAHSKLVGLPSGIFSSDISNATYLNFSSDKEIVGFQLNSATGDMMLDAVPALSYSASTLYFPHIASNSTWETEIAIVNTGSGTLTGELKAYNDAGQEVSSSKSISLAANGRSEMIVGGTKGFFSPSSIRHIIFTATSGSATGYTKFYVSGNYRAAIPAVSEINTGDIYIPHIASDFFWWTGISLVNTTSSSIDISFELNTGTAETVTIPALGHTAFTIDSLFSSQSQSDIQSAVIKNGNGIIGLELFGSGNLLSGILLKDDVTQDLYFPHVASDSTWWTGIVAYNASTTSADLTINPYSTNGEPLTGQNIIIEGQQKYIGTFSSLSLPNDTAWFQVSSNRDITGFELFGINPTAIDDDGDGYTENQGDCNDSDSSINPDATEICGDEIDQDCNGSDLTCFSGDYTNSLGMAFNLIPAGTFTMGSPEDELGRDGDEIQHQVTLTQSFYMQTTEVTQGQWEAVMGNNPSYFSSCGSDCPVEYVSWNDIQEFITALNQRGEGTYSLPTEAQWEYADRAGSTTALANGDITVQYCAYDPKLDAMGWYCYHFPENQTHPVAQKQANAWRLYDMHGNVWEWCQDWYGAYPTGSVTDPQGPSSGPGRIIRGGGWNGFARNLRSAERRYDYSPDPTNYLGFRLLRTP